MEKKREKYINMKSENFGYETPGFWKYEEKKTLINDESFLKLPAVQTKKK